MAEWIDLAEEERLLDQATARRAEMRRVRERVGGDFGYMAGEANRLLTEHAGMSAGLLNALLEGGVTGSPAAAQLADADDGGGDDGPFGLLSDVTDAVVGTAGDALEQVYEKGIKPAVRTVFTVAETASHELVQRPLVALDAITASQGEFDLGEVRRRYNEYGDSAGVNFLQGDLDEDAEGGTFGKGFFAGGQAQAESQNERTLEINGQKATLGRAIANASVGHFLEPGDFMYDLTAGLSGFATEVLLDPVAWATGGLSKGAQAARALDAGLDAGTVAAAAASGTRASSRVDGALLRAGLIRGSRRNTVLADRTRDFFADQKMLQRIADADEYDIMQTWRRSPAQRVDNEMVARLGAEKDPAKIAQILNEAVGAGMLRDSRGVFKGPGWFVRDLLVHSERMPARPFRYFTAEGKLSGLSPNGLIHADNLDEASLKVDSLMRQAHVDRDTRAAFYKRMIRIQPGAFDELFDVTTDAMNEIATRLPDGQKTEASISSLAKEFKGQIDDMRAYGVDSMGNDIPNPLARSKVIQNFDGEQVEVLLPTPQILSELNSMALSLPDAQTIRRAATKNDLLRRVYQSKGWGTPVAGMQKLTTSVFKPAALLRPAYIVRIGLEEQARLAAAHQDSIFSHPFRYLMANVVKRDELTDLMGNDLVGAASRRDIGVIARNAAGRMDDPLRSQARLYSTTSAPANGFGEAASDNYLRGWRGELGQISSSPEARKMAEVFGDLDEFKTWARNEGRQAIAAYAKGFDRGDELLDFGRTFDEWAEGLRTRVEAKTGGWDQELIGRIVDEDIPFDSVADRKGMRAFDDVLRRKIDEGNAPVKVKYEVRGPNAPREGMNRALNWMFENITSKPTNYFARFPAWRGKIAERAADMMDTLADDALRGEVFDRTVKALRLEGDDLARLKRARDDAKGMAGPVGTVEDFNDIALSRAAEDVKELLFDVTKRGAAQDTLNVMFPFLDAWKEVTTNWMRLLKENPAFFIRAQAGFRDLREQGSFYVNDYGEEVFRYPGGGVLANLVGADDSGVRLEGAIQGVNLVAQGVGPGFGPVVQWPATFLQDPGYDELRSFLAPFGVEFSEPKDLFDLGAHTSVFMPAWAEKGLNALTKGAYDERQWNSAVGDHLQAMAVSGDYDLNNPEDVQRMQRDAKRAAGWTLMARAGYQATGPTGPQATVEVALDDVDVRHEDWDPEKDPDGKWFTLNVLSQDYYRLAQTYGFDTAAEKFHEMYGVEPFYIGQGATSTQGRELPVTAEGGLWVRENRAVMEDYPLVAGFFAPTDDDADLDFSVYNAQIERGERISLTAEQQSRMAQSSRARTIWNAAKKRTENLPPAERERARQLVRARLEDTHPGWQSPVLAMPRPTDKIAELYRIAEDPRVQDEPLARPLKAYLEVRDKALAEVRQITGAPNATLARQDAAPMREELLAIGARLQARYPAFTGVWSSVLKNELQED